MALQGKALPVGGQYNATPPTYSDGDTPPLAVDANGKLLTSSGSASPTVALQSAIGLGSNKLITVAAGEKWMVQWVYLKFVSSATAGTRPPELNFLDASSNVIYKSRMGTDQGNNDTRYWSWIPGVPQANGSNQNMAFCPLPPGAILPAGYQIQVKDANNVDNAADRFDVYAQITKV